MNSTDEHYPERLVLLMPRGSKQAINAAAGEQCKTMSALARELLVNTFLLRRLKAESQPAAAPSVEAEIAAARQRLAPRKETMSETGRVSIVGPTVLPVDERVGVRGQYRVGGVD